MVLRASERVVPMTLFSLQGHRNESVEDHRLAAQAGMQLQDVRDWLKALEEKDLVKRFVASGGINAHITAFGRQEIRLMEVASGSRSDKKIVKNDELRDRRILPSIEASDGFRDT